MSEIIDPPIIRFLADYQGFRVVPKKGTHLTKPIPPSSPDREAIKALSNQEPPPLENVKTLSQQFFSVLNSDKPPGGEVLIPATNELMKVINQIISSKEGFKPEELQRLFLDELLSSDKKTLLEKLEELYEEPLQKHSSLGMSINFFQEHDEGIKKAEDLLRRLVKIIDQPADKCPKLGESVVLNDEEIHGALISILSKPDPKNNEVNIGKNFDAFVNELLARKFTNRITYVEGKVKFPNNLSTHEKYYERSLNKKLEKLSLEFNEMKDNIISPKTVSEFKEVYSHFKQNFYSLTV